MADTTNNPDSSRPIYGNDDTAQEQTENTVTQELAIEISKNCKPWNKAQIIVMFSRTRRSKDTIVCNP